eukprot:983704-Pyramimonas_sp.AAC.1
MVETPPREVRANFATLNVLENGGPVLCIVLLMRERPITAGRGDVGAVAAMSGRGRGVPSSSRIPRSPARLF